MLDKVWFLSKFRCAQAAGALAVVLISHGATALTPLQDLCLNSSDGDSSSHLLAQESDSFKGMLPALNLLFDQSSISTKLSGFSIASSLDATSRFLLLNRLYPDDISAYFDSHPKFFANGNDPASFSSSVELLTYALHFDVRATLERAAKTKPVYSAKDIQGVRQVLNKSIGGFQQTATKMVQQYGDRSCFFSFALNFPDRAAQIRSCQAAANWLIARTSITEVNEEQVSFVDNLSLVLTDPVYAQGISKLALRIWTKVNLVSANPSAYDLQSSDFGDLFDDTVNSFLEVDSQRDIHLAQDRAFMILGLYGSRGTSFSFLMPPGDINDASLTNADNAAVFLGLQVISAGLSVLERASIFSPKVYAFPAAVHTSCQQNRPYHFWMSAFLAREALKTGKFSAPSILAAIHSLEVAYKLAGPTSVPSAVSMPAYAQGTAIETQKDLTLGEAGAWVGLNWSNKKQIHLDTYFQNFLATGSSSNKVREALQDRLPPVERTLLQLVETQNGLTNETLDQWNSLVLPNENYDQMLKDLSPTAVHP